MFSRDVLAIDAPQVAQRIEAALREQVLGSLRRKGAVVGLSGGIDSSVVASLCVRALGKDKVLALFMPERDSSGDSLRLGKMVADHLGIRAVTEDIAPALAGLGCYARQEEAIRLVFPEYGEGYKCKITLPSILESDRLNYAVAGTPNLLEYDQGFFVKQGDGAADFKPIAHLYKTQVYALAKHLDVPAEIQGRPPTTDTFSMSQTQEEFYFALPYDRMDLCLYGHNHGVAAAEVAPAVNLTPEQVERVYRDIDAKRRATKYLHTRPLLVEAVEDI